MCGSVFSRGCAHAAVMNLYQDLLGKEAYLRVADAGWVSGWWTAPMALGVLAAVRPARGPGAEGG